MTLVAHINLKLHQMDLKVMFLNGQLFEEVYISLPEGFDVEGKEHMVCNLKKYLDISNKLWIVLFKVYAGCDIFLL